MEDASVNGIKFVGKMPHFIPLEHMGVPADHFQALRNAVVKLSK